MLVLNKSDRLNQRELDQNLSTARTDFGSRPTSIARKGLGRPNRCGSLRALELVDKQLVQDPVARQRFRLPLAEGRALHLLHDRAAITLEALRNRFL